MKRIWLLLLLSSPSALAKLNVLATVPDLAAIASEVGGDDAQVEAIAKGTQDAHYLEAKPSFMVKASRADLVIAVGLDLESGWLPSILRGARNPRVSPGGAGYLEVGPGAEPDERIAGAVSRAEGDVHPLGNPHVTLDPLRAGRIALRIADRMGELDPVAAPRLRERAKGLQQRLERKIPAWRARIARAGVKEVVTYHRTLNYFLKRCGLEVPVVLEPKPGIPPTSGHVLGVIETMRAQRILLILVENFFDPAVTRRISQEVPGVRVETVPVAVGGEPGISGIDDLYERLVTAIAGKGGA